MIRYTTKHLRLLIASLHAPHRGHEQHFIQTWWSTTRELLHKYGQTALVLLAGDLNASVGSIQSTQIGEVGQEIEDLPGQHWHQILAEMKCFLPCTFTEFQRGETHTYVQKRNKKYCRPDMIGVPFIWHTNAVRAWVAAEIHVALATQDHYATCVHVDQEMALPINAKKGAPKKVTPELICDPHNQCAIKQVLQSIPQVPWSVSSHAHAAIVVKHLQDGLRALATTVRSSPTNHTSRTAPGNSSEPSQGGSALYVACRRKRDSRPLRSASRSGGIPMRQTTTARILCFVGG